MRNLGILFFLTQLALAQQTVAPTPETAAKPRGEDWNGYNVVNSFEVGYRFAGVGGNLAQYQSVVNFHDGVRLLSSYLTLNSKTGHGRYFDELVLTTAGLGNDPYENAILRVQKNRLYRYDMSWRRNDFVNPGLTTGGALGQHALNTQYDMQDHDFTLYPDSKLKFFLGYTGSSQTGPALTSVQLVGPVYPLFANVHRVRHEYRAGNEFQLLGFRVNWLHGWEDFKEDSPVSLTGGGAPLLYTPGVSLTAFRRAEPYHGTSPYWRAALFRDLRQISINGRFTYTGGQRAFVQDETASAPGRLQTQQVIALGDARRPVATGNLNVTLLPTSKLTVVNSTAVYNVRTEGSSTFLQFNNFRKSSDLLRFQYLGIRTVSNETDLNYQLFDWFGISGGYQYSDRRIRSIEQTSLLGDVASIPSEQTNRLHEGTLGVRLRPYKGLSVLLSGELGRNDRPFTPIAGRNYHALNARLQYRHKTLLLTGAAQSSYRFTPVSLSAYSSQARTYSANGSWSPRAWLGFDAGYTRMHLFSEGGIAYFINFEEIDGERSLYLSNIHSLNAGARFAVRKRADVYVGYSRVQDTGDGRRNLTGAGVGSASPVFQAAQTFPVAFDSPQGRLSIVLRDRLRWNFGYQYYGYREKFYASQNFRANTGYTSLSWSF